MPSHRELPVMSFQGLARFIPRWAEEDDPVRSFVRMLLQDAVLKSLSVESENRIIEVNNVAFVSSSSLHIKVDADICAPMTTLINKVMYREGCWESSN